MVLFALICIQQRNGKYAFQHSLQSCKSTTYTFFLYISFLPEGVRKTTQKGCISPSVLPFPNAFLDLASTVTHMQGEA